MQRAPFHSNLRVQNMLYGKAYKQFYIIAIVCFYICLPARAMRGLPAEALTAAGGSVGRETKARAASSLTLQERRVQLINPVNLRRYKYQLREKLTQAQLWQARKTLLTDALELNLDPNSITYSLDSGKTVTFPLADAVAQSDDAFVEYLLKKEASVQQSDKTDDPFGRSLLFKAKTERIFELLVRAGARVNERIETRSELGYSLMYHLVCSALPVQCMLLCGKHGLDSCAAAEPRPLFHALFKISPLQIDKARALITLGASLDDKSPEKEYKGLTFVERLKIEIKNLQEAGNKPGELKQMQAFLHELEAVALERRKTILAELQSYFPPGVAALMLSFYEQENFKQTAADIAQVEHDLKIRKELSILNENLRLGGW